MKNGIIFLCIFAAGIAGCSSVKETITETEKEIPVLVTVPEMRKDSLDVTISDSTVVAIANDSSVSVKIIFPVGGNMPDTTATSFVRNETKRILNELRKLPVRPHASVIVHPSTVRGKATVTEKIIEREKEFGFFDYLKIGWVFFLIGVFVGVVVIVILRR